MSPVETLLAEVLAAHLRSGWAATQDRWSCACGESVPLEFGIPIIDQHRAHVAAEQAKALREWVLRDETQVAVSTALLREGRLAGTPTAMGGSVFAVLADLIGGAR